VQNLVVDRFCRRFFIERKEEGTFVLVEVRRFKDFQDPWRRVFGRSLRMPAAHLCYRIFLQGRSLQRPSSLYHWQCQETLSQTLTNSADAPDQ
ncbi:MAG: hypothetical protein WCA48_05515, partial [Pseudomonas gingeri]